MYKSSFFWLFLQNVALKLGQTEEGHAQHVQIDGRNFVRSPYDLCANIINNTHARTRTHTQSQETAEQQEPIPKSKNPNTFQIKLKQPEIETRSVCGLSFPGDLQLKARFAPKSNQSKYFSMATRYFWFQLPRFRDLNLRKLSSTWGLTLVGGGGG